MRSSVDTRSETFQANRAAMVEALDEVGALNATVVQGGGSSNPAKAATAVARHRERGKLLPRERIAGLLDADSPFLELSPLAGWGSQDELGVGLVTGIGWVNGVECLISANDPTVKGGSQSPMTMHKALRAMEIARVNRLPLVNLIESGGADLPKQAEVFVPGGASFRNLTQLSAAGIPTITLVFGSSTAGGAYVPGMSDYVVMVRSARPRCSWPARRWSRWPSARTPTRRSSGGAEMHARISGLADYLAEDELDALRIGREIVAPPQLAQARPGADAADAAEPAATTPRSCSASPAPTCAVPFDTREVIARIVDGSRFDEFKPLYGTQLVTGWAELHGYPVGILANNGVLFSEESQKAAQFIQLCNRDDTPLLFLQNTTGFMVGTRLRAARDHQGRRQDDQRRLQLARCRTSR